MSNQAPDMRALLRALVAPTSNEQYVRDQQIMSSLFKEPGERTDWKSSLRCPNTRT